MVFVVVSATASMLASTFQCTPIHKAWVTVPGSCINVNALFFANAALDIFQDAVIYVLPMRMLYHIQIPKRQKIALMGVFAVGGFVVITGMIRLNFLKRAQDSPDPSCKHFLFFLLKRNSLTKSHRRQLRWRCLVLNRVQHWRCMRFSANIQGSHRPHIPWLNGLQAQSFKKHSSGGLRNRKAGLRAENRSE